MMLSSTDWSFAGAGDERRVTGKWEAFHTQSEPPFRGRMQRRITRKWGQ